MVTKEKVEAFVSEAYFKAKKQYENEIRDEEWDKAVKFQKDKDIKAAVRAFMDLKVKDQDIFGLLNKYFEIDSISEATEFLNEGKKSRQIIALRVFCENNGMSGSEFAEYAREHHLEEKLASDQKLLELSPDKLKAAIDKG